MATRISQFLRFCAVYGRWILVLSLVVGLLSPFLANLVKPYIEVLIALLLFTTCLRVGPKQALGAIHDLRVNLAFTIFLQVLLPLTLVVIYRLGEFQNPLWLALILLTSAPAISGSPHLVTLLGFDPSIALRQMILGTILLPITIIPVLTFIPDIGNPSDIIIASTRLLVLILGAGAIAFTIRYYIWKDPGEEGVQKIDGVATILLATVVFGLMAAIHNEVAFDPHNLALTLFVAVSANFSLQIITALILTRYGPVKYTVPMGLIAGNRNIALFMTALAITKTQPLLLFIACYQIPMYLTPIIMRRFYHKWGKET